MRVSSFSLLIPQGRERDSGHVEIDHNTVYTLRLGNHSTQRCDAQVSVDGKDVGAFRLDYGSTITLERPSGDQGRFTFFKSDSPEAEAANVAGIERDQRGLVQVVFKPERYRPVPTVKKSSGIRAMSAFAGDAGEKTSAGITGLTGHSDQRFHTVAPLDYDPQAEVTITLRLIAVSVPVVRELVSRRGNPVPSPVE